MYSATNPPVRAILAVVALTLALFLPAGGPNKGNSTGIWIIPSCVPLTELSSRMASHDLTTATEVHSGEEISAAVTFELPVDMADSVGTAAFGGNAVAVSANGMYVTVDATVLQAAVAGGDPFVNVMLTDGVNASGAVFEFLPSGGYRIFVY